MRIQNRFKQLKIYKNVIFVMNSNLKIIINLTQINHHIEENNKTNAQRHFSSVTTNSIGQLQ